MTSAFIPGQKDLLESILHGIIITDLRGHITYWNGSCEQMLGYSSLETIDKTIQMIFDEEAVPFKENLKKIIKEKRVQGHWYAKCKDKSRLWLDVRIKLQEDSRGKPQFCVISLINMEILEATKRDLARSQQLAEVILETSADAIITTDEHGFMLSLNKSAEEMFGYKRSEMILKKVGILLPATYRDTLDFFSKSSVDKDTYDIHGTERELYALKKDGTVFPVNISINEISWYGNRIFVGVIRDLSKRRELEMKIAEISNEERRHIGRELHDGLGQMLTGIRMVSENLAKKSKATDAPYAREIQEIADMIQESDQYVRTISRGMAEANLEKYGLNVAIQNLLARVEKTTDLKCDYQENVASELKDQTKILNIYRIVQEAINNVVRHAEAKYISVHLLKNDHNILLEIDDNGKGFENEQDLKKGSGVQIMKYRAELLGGILDISRITNHITRVRCLIPNSPNHL